MTEQFVPTVFAAALEAARAMLAEEQATKYRSDRYQVSTPEDAASLLQPYFAGREQEVFAVLLLDTRMRPLQSALLYKGTINATKVRVAEVFRDAVKTNARAIIVAHNHPSGDTRPSNEDLAFTLDLIQGGEVLDIPVLDHLIFGAGNDWISIHRKRPDLGWKTEEKYLEV